MVTSQQALLFKQSADTVFETGDYTSATVLYFKTWFAIHDVILLQKIGYAPKDHTERFRLLEKEFPESYSLLNEEFNTYRSTYSRIIPKETCIRIKKLVEHELKHYHLS